MVWPGPIHNPLEAAYRCVGGQSWTSVGLGLPALSVKVYLPILGRVVCSVFIAGSDTKDLFHNSRYCQVGLFIRNG